MKEDALLKTFDLYAAPLYRYALRLSGDPSTADRIVGDVFTRLLERYSNGQGPEPSLRPYLYEIAHALLMDERRSSPETLLFARQAETPEGTDPILLRPIVRALQNDLTDDERHVILLRFLEEFSLPETAGITHKSVNDVETIQGRALAKLRNASRGDETQPPASLPGMENPSEGLRPS